MAAHDVDRQVSYQTFESWNEATGTGEKETGKLVLDGTLSSSLLVFIQKSLLDPGQVYLDLNPAPPVVIAPPTTKKVGGRTVAVPSMKREDSDVTRSKGEGDEESEQDRKARLRVGALGALIWILGRSPFALFCL